MEVKNLVIEYPMKEGNLRAVDDVSFSLKSGESMGLVGESGCGKTTIGLSLMRLLKGGEIKAGSINFDDNDVSILSDEDLSKIRGKKISMIFQASQNALNPLQKVASHFIDTFKAHDMWSNSKWDEINKIIERIEISKDRINEYPHQFSGGMQQRIVIALSVILQPTLLIADEPTTALDVLVQAKILKLLRELKSEYNLTMIFISHDLGVVAEITQRLAIMYAGQLVEIGTTKDIFANPQHPYTEALLNAIPDVQDKTKKKQISIPGTPPDLRFEIKGCRFASRCSYRKDICNEEPPELLNIINGKIGGDNPNHKVRCLKYNDDF
ncbi:MAG: ABC transporter ATP-binding protein [Candidatus Heimdallarchaeota archaeon]|nr:ABC transporter ATP-binding protein [Candidatus Heimdallarchaeota archaeon]